MAAEENSRAVTVAYILMLLVVVFWASAFAGIRYMLWELDPAPFTTLRLVIALAGMLVAGAIARTRLPRREDLPMIIFAGLCGYTFYHLLLNTGGQWVTAGQMSFVIATIPIWTIVLAWKFLGERITQRQSIGLAISLIGVGLISLSREDLQIPLGSALILGSAVLAGANIVSQKSLLGRYRATDMAVYVTIAGCAPFVFHVPFVLEDAAALSAKSWLILIYLGLVPITLGYWLSTIALKALPAGKTSMMLLLNPPMTALIAFFAIAEVPGPRVLIAGPIVLFGVALGTIRLRRRIVPPR